MSEISKGSIKVEYVAIDALTTPSFNPRKHDVIAEEKLKDSIKRFGMLDPLIVNSAPKRKNIVIGGNFRLSVAKSLGFTQVPVVYVNIPDLEREKELNVRLNRNTGEWDWDLLKEFNMEMLIEVGFDETDLSHIWDDTLSVEEDDFDSEKAAAAIKKPKTKLGEMFQLGDHILLCGDSTDPKAVSHIMGKHKVDMCYSDFPYNISLDYSKGISTKGKYGGKVDDNKSPVEYRVFLKTCIENAKAVAKPDAHFFMWVDQLSIGLLQSLYEETGIKNKRVCLWVKNNFNMTPQIAFNKAYEPCVYGVIGSPYLCDKVMNLTEILNRDIQPGNRTIDDIVDLFDIWLAKRLNGQDYTHPTEKPVSLHEKPLRRCTKPGDIVLDLFGGSGSTMAACEQMKRKSFTIEKDPVFCDVIIQRYEKLTNQKAKRIN
ncbi:MAG: DNA modification methylase [Patescibacteria group bacterium]